MPPKPEELIGRISLWEAERELAERSLREYIEWIVWPVLEPMTPFIGGWHIDCICEHLEAVTLGQITRLIINIPPRYMKSTTVTIGWPTWEWGPKRLAHHRFLCSSYSHALSVKHNVDRRTVIESAAYQRNWGSVFKLLSDNNRKDEFWNDKRGSMQTTSTNGTATGKGGNRLIIDDPINPKEAVSDVERENANEFCDQTLYSRLDDKRKDPIVVVMQRLHTNDPTGHFLKQGGWVHLKLPAEEEKKTTIVFPISKRTVEREVGDVLWPEKEPREVLARSKVGLGSYGYAGQYQQNPVPLGGGVIKAAWFKRFSMTQRPITFDYVIISADPKFKDYETKSRVAVHTWGAVGPNLYLLARTWDHLGLVNTITTIVSHRQRAIDDGHYVSAVLVEDKANGPAIIEVLRNKVPGLIPVEPDGSKEARALAASPTIEAGNVWIPAEPWGDEFIDAWSFVPNGENWDDVDAASQAIRYLSQFTGITGAQAGQLLGKLQSGDSDGYLT